MLYGLADEFLFAGKIEDREEPVSTLYWLQEGPPFGHFARLCAAVEKMFADGMPVQPVERTLLTSGILDRVMQSRHAGGVRLETPELNIGYRPS